MNFKQLSLTDWLRLTFGIFMVLVYLGMAVLLAINFFDWSNTRFMVLMRYGMAVVFAVYGVYRGYRQWTGKDYYRVQDLEDRYGTYGDNDDDKDTKQ